MGVEFIFTEHSVIYHTKFTGQEFGYRKETRSHGTFP